MERVPWGIIGTGAIASTFARAVSKSSNGRLSAVASRSAERASGFSEKYGVPVAYSSYEELIDDPDIQAVYISTPHTRHAAWTIPALEAGKHVLCEKPLTVSHGEVMAVVECARESGMLLAEAFMYRLHPQTSELLRLLESGEIGEVRLIRASFGFGGDNPPDSASRLFDPELAGGAIMDVGCYPVSMARLVAGAARREAVEPTRVTGAAHLGETAVDEWSSAVLHFDGGLLAECSTAVRLTLDNSLIIFGSKGRIELPNPWQADREQAHTGVIIVRVGGSERRVEVPADRSSFTYEVEAFSRAVLAGEDRLPYPAMSPEESLGNALVLESWRDAVGLRFPTEEPEGNRPVRGTLSRRPSPPVEMQYGSVPGLDKAVSRFVFGCDNQRRYSHGAAVWDDFFERGGTAFDTSWVYGGGLPERLLGAWIADRGVREELVVISKGAHTPRCYPDLLRIDFEESLDRMGLEYADIYLMHRDNPDVRVGEFVDALDELCSEGLIRGAVGGSNWSPERFEAARSYARENGKRVPGVLSNNLSLAEMVKPVWPGCVHMSDEQSRAWLRDSGISHFAWSSQARGYFLPPSERMKLGADNFACWDSVENRRRRERAETLARRYGCSPLNVAAAYVLSQPFNSFALIGPRQIHETADALNALRVHLSEEEVSRLWKGES